MFVADGKGLVTKTTVVVGHDGQTHAESFIETFDMDKEIQEKVKRSRRSRERRSTIHKQQQQGQPENYTPRQNIQPSAPILNDINNYNQYGKSFRTILGYFLVKLAISNQKEYAEVTIKILFQILGCRQKPHMEQ